MPCTRNPSFSLTVVRRFSRSGKTPLSIYLGQRGYKVANLPLVKGIPVPKQLYEIDQSKVFGLILDAKELHTIRQTRLNSLGVGGASSSAQYAALRVGQKSALISLPEWANLVAFCLQDDDDPSFMHGARSVVFVVCPEVDAMDCIVQ